MVARLVFFIMSLVALVAFQNCAQSPQSMGSAGQRGIAQTMDSKTFVFTDDYGRIGSGSSELTLNVESGEISYAAAQAGVQASLSAPTSRYCLDEDERSELALLLAEDQVCALERGSKRRDYLCTAIYRPAYAKYGSQTQSLVSVGETISGCEVRADFCSGNGESIRQIIEQVKASLDTRACPTI